MQRKPSQKSATDKLFNHRINEKITGVSRVRLVSDDGVEIVTFDEALRKAREENLDLVEVSGDQEVHVCKIIDYGKYKFELLKKSKEAKKKQHVINVKEIKIRPRIESHDYDIKKKHAQEFLSKGDKVKVSLRFRGREMMHSDLGMKVVYRMVEDLKEFGSAERDPIQDGKQIVVIINPK
ncbi:translation initiation factor IF-3 [Leptospira stimsonii]|uniref:Translation initiation factor IF-3 n=1 Tax=Leptospira stimsonii TaxID=2202203 RepID=A0A4V3JUY6_9LEPT|nr:translation initiation factor IF-3 [Leptospira stimsonii]RHX85981.1 translation initiation factor IF-3 [Leptospira stimsonii]RHX87242.1 translation initiation factor IF-3 [Leptospira stimsonii]TGK19717.1 translation initiation factor IF-3 [Leptospira stimsonii]TGM13716.1 translation initiation factor IF-3 [Leptospira stimsonii]